MKKQILLLSLLFFAFLSSYSQTTKQIPSTELKGLSLRSNVIPWAALTPNLGVEYRTGNQVGILVNGMIAHWKWKDGDRRHNLWQVAPQVRYYLGSEYDSYIGLEGQVGQYNLLHSSTGRQGNVMGAGLTLGHQFYAGKNLMVDLGFGVGYLRFSKKERYERINGVNVRDASAKTGNGYWGPTSLSMTFVWKVN